MKVNCLKIEINELDSGKFELIIEAPIPLNVGPPPAHLAEACAAITSEDGKMMAINEKFDNESEALAGIGVYAGMRAMASSKCESFCDGYKYNPEAQKIAESIAKAGL